LLFFLWWSFERNSDCNGKSMVTIPVKIRQKYGIKEGMKVEFVDLEDAVLIVPLRSLKELKGLDKAHEEVLKEAIRELNEEHRKEVLE